jgi:hypothetical protein
MCLSASGHPATGLMQRELEIWAVDALWVIVIGNEHRNSNGCAPAKLLQAGPCCYPAFCSGFDLLLCFCALRRPLLQELLAELQERYPGVDFPPIPQPGDLDLSQVSGVSIRGRTLCRHTGG